MLHNLNGYSIILGSQSPRRQQLLKGLNVKFDIVTSDADEHFPAGLKKQDIPLYLSKQKALAIVPKLQGNFLLITCDTVVWINDEVLNKPVDKTEAHSMLRKLSGQTHEVFTAVTITTTQKSHSFYDRTAVSFKQLTDAEIDYYIDTCKPFDKAGSYGVQEWLGYVAIYKIEGCFFNVMGLPLNRLYDELKIL
ncbi:MAG TPA: Maf family nucleotide pyrophosphatase [Flavobacteriales bacterium]|nr:Maf family nucleotide pyrophosphatase [Flavobacteriales bacterium]